MPSNRLPRVMKHYSVTGRRNYGRTLKRLLDTWDRNGSKSGPNPWQIYNDDDDVIFPILSQHLFCLFLCCFNALSLFVCTAILCSRLLKFLFQNLFLLYSICLLFSLAIDLGNLLVPNTIASPTQNSSSSSSGVLSSHKRGNADRVTTV